MASTLGLCTRCCTITLQRSAVQIARVARWHLFRSSTTGPNLLRWQSNNAAAAARVEPSGRMGALQHSDDIADNTFNSLKGSISPDTLKAITIKPFKMTTMTPVQAAVLPLLPALADPYSPTPAPDAPEPVRDLLVKARTGTGKTIAFLVPAIEARLRSIEATARQAVKDAGLASDRALEGRVKRVFSRTEVGTLVISPTRELATQIANEALRLAYHHDNFEVRLFVGGMSKRTQMRDWMKGRRDIVVATPGRLLDLLNSEPEIQKGISKTRILVLDEADTLLSMGFRDDIEAIKEFLPPTPERQNFMFSATVSREIQQVARSTLAKNHMFINTVSDNEAPVHISVPQFHTVLPSPSEQIPCLLRLIAHDQLTNPGKSKILLFLPTTKMTQLFATLLRELSLTSLPSLRNTRVYEIHSKRSQDARTNTSDAFRHDKTGASILVSSDVSARGVDYPGVTRVIQLGIPAGTEEYIHRIGRTGRAGTGGRGDLVLLPWEVGFLTWQLEGVPLKPLTTNELKSQLSALAQTYDVDPAAAFKDVRAIPVGALINRLDAGKPRMYSDPVTPILDKISQAVDNLLPSLDEEAVKETFASLLGYYLSKSPELRTQKGVIVQGCKDWATGACGLPVPPYVSEAFLQRMGFSDGRPKRFGQSFDRGRAHSSERSSPWSGRGQQRLRDRVREVPDWAKPPEDLDTNGRFGDPEEYRSQGFNSRGRADPPHHSISDVPPPRRVQEFGRRDGGYGSRSDSYGGRSDGYGERNGAYGNGTRSGGYGSRRDDGGGRYGLRR